MRCAAVKTFRTTCLHTARGLTRPGRRSALVWPPLVRSHPKSSSSSSSISAQQKAALQKLMLQRAQSRAQTRAQQQQILEVFGEPLQASMHIRRLTAALVSGVVGFGAYYAYQSDGSLGQWALFSSASEARAAAAATAGGVAAAATTAAARDAQRTRNVLVIGSNELGTATVVGDGPLSKLTDDAGRRVLEMLTPEQTTQRLRQNEESYSVRRGQGVLRYDLVQVASNDPIEDDHAEKIVAMPRRGGESSESSKKGDSNTSDWMFWGVFDGHSGWTTSAKLRQALIGFVARELNETFSATTAASGTPSAEAIEAAIKTGFTRLDDEIVHQSAARVLGQTSKTVAAEQLAPALSGSCALLAFYDSPSQLLRVACTGDSRAVLGRRVGAAKWTAVPLSVDQTGSNPDEAARLRAQHPGEDHVVRNGRVLGGLEPTRAFGDAVYKWSREVASQLRTSFFGRSQSPLLRTPPYVTAEPVVTTTKIEPERGDFVIMATDGLWEMLTNEEAVGLVGQWIEAAAAAAQKDKKAGGGSSSGISAKGLPVEKASHGPDHGERTPIRLQQWGLSPDAEGRFVVKDANAATHLIRNALGGSDEEQVSALLTLPAPFSRRYRDDLTVQVIFFGNGPTTGDVVLNKEASGPGPVARAKL